MLHQSSSPSSCEGVWRRTILITLSHLLDCWLLLCVPVRVSYSNIKDFKMKIRSYLIVVSYLPLRIGIPSLTYGLVFPAEKVFSRQQYLLILLVWRICSLRNGTRPLPWFVLLLLCKLFDVSCTQYICAAVVCILFQFWLGKCCSCLFIQNNWIVSTKQELHVFHSLCMQCSYYLLACPFSAVPQGGKQCSIGRQYSSDFICKLNSSSCSKSWRLALLYRHLQMCHQMIQRTTSCQKIFGA